MNKNAFEVRVEAKKVEGLWWKWILHESVIDIIIRFLYYTHTLSLHTEPFRNMWNLYQAACLRQKNLYFLLNNIHFSFQALNIWIVCVRISSIHVFFIVKPTYHRLQCMLITYPCSLLDWILLNRENVLFCLLDDVSDFLKVYVVVVDEVL